MNELDAGAAIPIETETVPVRRILGLNPGPMTGPGTNSYLIGEERLSLLDPGPADEAQLRNFLQAIGDAKLENILITHTHADHSPGALALQKATGATLRCMPLAEDARGCDASSGEGGECVATGRKTQRRAIFAKAY